MKKMFVLFISLIFCGVTPLYATTYTITTDIEAIEDSEGSKVTDIVEVDQLLDGITFQDTREILIGTDKYCIKKAIVISVDEIVLVGDIDNGNKPYQALNKFAFPFVMYVKNDNIVFTKVLDENGYGVFNDVCLTPNGFMAIGEIEVTPINRDVVFYEFSSNGEILKSTSLLGSKEDFGIGIDYQEDYCYYTVKTSSDDGDYIGNNKSKIAMGTIKYDDFSFLGIRYVIEDNSNYRNVLYDEEYVYVSIVDNYYYTILRYTKDGEANNYYTFEEPMNINMHLKKINNKLVFYQQYSFNDEIMYYEIDKDMNNTKKIVIDFHKELYKVDSVSFMNDEDNIIAFATFTPLYGKISRIKLCQLYNSEFELVKENIEEIIKEEIIITSRTVDEFYSLYTVINQNFEFYIKKNNITFIQAIRYEEENPHFYKQGYLLKINNRNVSTNKVEDINMNNYQTIETYDQYHTHNLNVFIPSKYECKAMINVSEGEKYDIGTKLIFNGKGYLNGISISSNHIVSNPGFYTLKVVNNENKNTTCSFIIEDMSLNLKDTINDNKIVILNNEIEDEKNNFQKLEYEVISRNDDSSYGLLIFIIVLSLLLGAISGLIILKFVKKRRLHND